MVDIKTSICQSHQHIDSFPLSRNVEWKMRSMWNTTSKTVSQYGFLMALIARYLCFQKPLVTAIRVIGSSCKAAIKLLNFFLNEANVNTIKSKQGRYFIP